MAAPEQQLPKLLQTYLRLLHNHPLAVSTTTSFAAAAVGDLSAQLAWGIGLLRPATFSKIDEAAVDRGGGTIAAVALQYVPETLATPEMGMWRTLRFAACTGAMVGFVGERWFRGLLAAMPGKTYEVALRTTVDLLVFAPSTLATIAGTTTMLSAGSDREYFMHKMRHDCVHALGPLWSFWLGGTVASYLLVPSPWQPPFALVLSTVWCTYISSRLHRPLAGTQRKEDANARVGEFLRGSRVEDQRDLRTR